MWLRVSDSVSKILWFVTVTVVFIGILFELAVCIVQKFELVVLYCQWKNFQS